MADEIKIVGSVNLVEVVSTLNHVVEEMSRLGEVVAEEGRENRARFENIKNELTACRSELKDEINALDKSQLVTSKDVKYLTAKVATAVTFGSMVLGWILKSGLVAML